MSVLDSTLVGRGEGLWIHALTDGEGSGLVGDFAQPSSLPGTGCNQHSRGVRRLEKGICANIALACCRLGTRALHVSTGVRMRSLQVRRHEADPKPEDFQQYKNNAGGEKARRKSGELLSDRKSRVLGRVDGSILESH